MDIAYLDLDAAMRHARNRGKCTKMHAHLGPGVDGCQLFDGCSDPSDMLCGACGCHMSFHTKLTYNAVHKYEANLDSNPLPPPTKRGKVVSAFEPATACPAESVGDNLDSPGLEVTSGVLCVGLDLKPKVAAAVQPLPSVMDSPLYARLCAKLHLIQQEYPEELHGKFSIVHDEDHGFRVYCGGCDKRYGISKPGYSLGNFERGHLASKRHKDVGPKLPNFLKRTAKTMYCG